jgi:indoleacetamide hydrolase
MLFKQGAILFAKSNMHELALGGTSANPTFGYVKNPYDLSHIPGGSSGGTAAAIAARIVPLGIGSDTAGSIRIPAHFCGIAGFRPSNPKTNKFYPVDGIVPLEVAFDIPGPMARNVSDIALVHSAIAHGAELTPADLRGVRIGIPRNYFWETLDDDVAKIAEAALGKLQAEGAVLVDVGFDDLAKPAVAARAVLMPEGLRVDLGEFLAREYPAITMKDVIASIASKSVRLREEDARDQPPSADEVMTARKIIDALGARYRDAFRRQNIGAIAYPTIPFPAPLLPTEGEDMPATFEISGRQYPAVVIRRNTVTGTIFGAPGLSIPAGDIERFAGRIRD